MSALNGDAEMTSASALQIEVPTKRKREASHSVIGDGLELNHDALPSDDDTIQDIWTLLKARDPNHSILDMVASKPSTSSSEGKPAAKRTKMQDVGANEDIGSMVLRHGYDSLNHFAADVKAACSEILAYANTKGSNAVGTVPWKFIPDTIGQDRAIVDIKAFTKFFVSLINRESKHRLVSQQSDRMTPKKEQIVANAGSTLIALEQDGKGVLTLFANAQGHKQLFSSFQEVKPRKNMSRDTTFGKLQLDVNGDIAMPLRENGLPNGIASSHVIPINSGMFQKDVKKAQRLGDVFPPPANQPALNRPKTPKYTTRGSSITWTRENSASAPVQKGNYTTEKLSTGQWLGYSGFAPAEDISAPDVKRKQRDRALSTGESGHNRSDGAKAAFNQAREDALFCRVYSSFAPSRDDTAALVPVELKNEVWWRQQGCDLFDQIFTVDPLPMEMEEYPTTDLNGDSAAYEEVINGYSPPAFDFKNEHNSNAVDDTLKRISETLAILHSFQRIRNMSLTSNRRASIAQESSKEDLTRSLNVPSSAETKAYKILRDEIATLISSLPPYAVAKLNGDQLAELNLSRSIILESNDYKGVMEEDITARAAKAAAQSASISAGVASGLGRPAGSTSYGGPSSQRPSSQRGTPANAGQPALARSSSSFVRQNTSNWNQPASTSYTSNGQRPGYTQTPTYAQTQQTPRPTGQAMPRSAPLTQYIQRAQNQQYAGNYQTPTQPAYQQRAQDQSNGGSVGYYRNPTQPPQQTARSAAIYQTATPQTQVPIQARPPQAIQPQPQPQTQPLINSASPRPLTSSTSYAQGQSPLNTHAQAVQHAAQAALNAQAALRSVSGTPAPPG